MRVVTQTHFKVLRKYLGLRGKKMCLQLKPDLWFCGVKRSGLHGSAMTSQHQTPSAGKALPVPISSGNLRACQQEQMEVSRDREARV